MDLRLELEGRFVLEGGVFALGVVVPRRRSRKPPPSGSGSTAMRSSRRTGRRTSSTRISTRGSDAMNLKDPVHRAVALKIKAPHLTWREIAYFVGLPAPTL